MSTPATTITTPQKMSPSQFAVLLFFAGGPTPKAQGIRIAPGMITDQSCTKRGWLVEIEEHPYKRTTHAGLEAAGLYIDQHDGHATDIQEGRWHCHTCRVYQAPHHARPTPATPSEVADIHLWTGLGSQHHAVCGEPVADLKTAPDIADVTCPKCKGTHAEYAAELRTELGRFANREAPYDQPATAGPLVDAQVRRHFGITRDDAAAVLQHIAGASDEAVAVADAYREVGGEVDPQTLLEAHGVGDELVLGLIDRLATGDPITRHGNGIWFAFHEPTCTMAPMPTEVVTETIQRGYAKIYTSHDKTLVSLHLPGAFDRENSLLSEPPDELFPLHGHLGKATLCGFRPNRDVGPCLRHKLHHTLTVADVQIHGRRVADYSSGTGTRGYHRCAGHRTTNAAGYVVRQTLDLERRQIGTDGEVGVDVAVYPSKLGRSYDPAYGRALDAARLIRSIGQSYAVIDTLYHCGHRL